jgi:hypothetical protein
MLRHPSGAFRLLALIAMRARYSNSETSLNICRLEIGECFVGRSDHRECGLSEKEYRTALKLLEDWNIVQTRLIKGRGTIVKLIERAIFDPLSGSELGQVKGQPITEGNLRGEGQPRGQQNGQQRASKRANKGPLTIKGRVKSEEGELPVRTMWEAEKRLEAINNQITGISQDSSRKHYDEAKCKSVLNEDALAEVKQLRTRKAELQSKMAGL